MRYWRRGVWVGAVALSGAVLTVALQDGDFTDSGSLTTALGFVLSVTGLAVDLVRNGPPARAEPPSAEELERTAEQLAAAVREQWQSEWRLRRLQDPDPLQVRWGTVEPWLSDHGENISGAPVDLIGRLDNIADVHQRVPSRRLVVLGRPGSGKSVLALRFTLDVLERRLPGDPVPVIFLPSTWQADREGLYEWLGTRLAADYPALAARSPQGVTRAHDLLRTGRILPVLDGLDEIPEQLQVDAIRRLNSELDTGSPLLLTCRTQVYEETVETGDVFTSAAVVELHPLTFADAAAYLVRTARPLRGDGGHRSTRWDGVLSHLHQHPDDPAGLRLRQVLSTPLMVAMARSVYNDANADPAELLGARFASPADLEHHLLDAFVPAAFAEGRTRDTSTGQARWNGQDAHRWLGFLARHLDHRNSRDLAWWELSSALPWPLRRFAPILLIGAATVTASLWWLKSPGPHVPYSTAAFVLGVCVGYGILSGRRRTERSDRSLLIRHAALSLAVVAPLGVALGFAQTLSFEWAYFDPAPQGRGLGAWTAWGLLFGVATAVVLTTIGIGPEPRPSTLPLRAMQKPRSVAGRVMGAVAVLLAAAIAFTVTYLASAKLSTRAASVVLAGLLVALAVRHNSGPAVRTGPSRTREGRAAAIRRSGRAALRGLAVGLLAGLAFGVTYGVADAAVLAVRAGPDFPANSRVHTQPDGTRYAIAPDGWRYVRSPSGDRYVRMSHAVHGVVYHDFSDRYAVPARSAKDRGCGSGLPCEPFSGPVELHLVNGAQDSVRVRLPDGTFAEDDGFRDALPPAVSEWLFMGSPGQLAGAAAGLGLTGGLFIGIISGLVAGLYRLLDSPTDVTRAQSPIASLHTDRATAVTRGMITTVVGVAPGLLLLLWVLPPLVVSDGLSLAVVIWLMASPLALGLSAWGWLLTTRLWLCGTGRLPWRLMAFLDQAHRRGVLRQAGAVYQFRHARLQERLATRSHEPG